MNEEKQIAYCGIDCLECGAYIATKNNDDKLRKETAEQWSKKLNFEFKWENLNCDGGCCNPKGKVMVYCQSCAIRKCAQEKGVVNCAYCSDYSCDQLEGFLRFVPGAKKTLEEVKQKL